MSNLYLGYKSIMMMSFLYNLLNKEYNNKMNNFQTFQFIKKLLRYPNSSICCITILYSNYRLIYSLLTFDTRSRKRFRWNKRISVFPIREISEIYIVFYIIGITVFKGLSTLKTFVGREKKQLYNIKRMTNNNKLEIIRNQMNKHRYRIHYKR